MTRPESDHSGPHVSAQVAGSWAAYDAGLRDASLRQAWSAQDHAYARALEEVQGVREFLGSPGSILGNPATKHGEIAEQVHVGVSRARDALFGRAPSASFDGVGRTAPMDYRVDGVDVQSKYINGLRSTLEHVSKHADKYPDFARDGGLYHIPRDQASQLDQLVSEGRIDGFSERSARSIQQKLGGLEARTGHSPDELIHPGEATYQEVQQGRVHDTIDHREHELTREDEALKTRLQSEHGPTLQGLGTAAALGGAAGAGVRLGQALWVKYREGKRPFCGQFTSEDWQDVGVEGARGAGTGAVAGGAMYLLTNSTELAAPVAGALVSGLMGIGGLLPQYRAGVIDAEQFAELSQLVAADAALVGLAAMAGQVLIPIPMVGPLLGSLTGKLVAASLREALGESEQRLVDALHEYERQALGLLDSEARAALGRLELSFGKLQDFASIAFDQQTNTAIRLRASISLAEAVGVDSDLILRAPQDLDAFMSE